MTAILITTAALVAVLAALYAVFLITVKRFLRACSVMGGLGGATARKTQGV